MTAHDAASAWSEPQTPSRSRPDGPPAEPDAAVQRAARRWRRRTSPAASASTAATPTRPGRRSSRPSASSKAAERSRSPRAWPRCRRCSTWSPSARPSSQRGTATTAPWCSSPTLEQRGMVKVDARRHRRHRPGRSRRSTTTRRLLWIESPTNPALEVADLPRSDRGRARGRVRWSSSTTRSRPRCVQRPLVARRRRRRALRHEVPLRPLRRPDRVGRHRRRRDLPRRRREAPRPRRAARHAGGLAGPARPAHAAAAGRARARPTPASWHGGSRCIRRSSGSATPASAASSRSRCAAAPIAADLVTHGTRLWVHATSLGGVESTMERRRRWQGEPDTIPDSPDPAQRRHRGRRRPLARPRSPHRALRPAVPRSVQRSHGVRGLPPIAKV